VYLFKETRNNNDNRLQCNFTGKNDNLTFNLSYLCTVVHPLIILRLLEHRLFTPLLRKTQKSISIAKTPSKSVVIESLFSSKLSTSSSFPNNTNIINGNITNGNLPAQKSNSNYYVKKHDKRKSSEGNALSIGGHKASMFMECGAPKKIKIYSEMATIPSIHSSLDNLTTNENETENHLSSKQQLPTPTSTTSCSLLINDDLNFKKSFSNYGVNNSNNFQKSRYSSESLSGGFGQKANQVTNKNDSNEIGDINEFSRSKSTGPAIPPKSNILDFGKKILKRVNSGNNRSSYVVDRNKKKIVNIDKKLTIDQSLASSADNVYYKDDINDFAKELINLPTFIMPNEHQRQFNKSFIAIDGFLENKPDYSIKKINNPKIIIDSSFEDGLDNISQKTHLLIPKLERFSKSLNCLCDNKKCNGHNDSNNRKQSKLCKTSNSNIFQDSSINGYLKKFKKFRFRSKSVANVNNSNKSDNKQTKIRASCDRNEIKPKPDYSNKTKVMRPQNLNLNEIDRNKLKIINSSSRADSRSRTPDSNTNSNSNSFTFLPTPKVGSSNLSFQFQFDENAGLNNQGNNSKRIVHFSPTPSGNTPEKELQQPQLENSFQQNENQIIDTFKDLKHKPGSEVLVLISLWIKRAPNDFLGITGKN
jgi:hypothetical protein